VRAYPRAIPFREDDSPISLQTGILAQDAIKPVFPSQPDGRNSDANRLKAKMSITAARPRRNWDFLINPAPSFPSPVGFWQPSIAQEFFKSTFRTLKELLQDVTSVVTPHPRPVESALAQH
jgi:hypothetical protein